MKISIIITARNYGRYLEETVTSCYHQNVIPYEVIYSDDFSTDNSLEVAYQLSKMYKTFKVVKQDKHLGVVGARNAGFEASSGDVLLFMDGDDILPPDYIEKHLEVFDETTPFVYGAAHGFGYRDVFWNAYAWKKLFIWDWNYVNTSCLMWRDTFIKAGKWRDTNFNTMWDFDLALRMSKLGRPKVSTAVLEYRQHDTSWSYNTEKKNYFDIYGCVKDIRDSNILVSIGLVYGGRINIMNKWMENLIEDISILKNKPELIIVNNSVEKLDLKKYEKYFNRIKIINNNKYLSVITYNNEIERRNKVCELLSNCYNILLEHCKGEVIHFREDDILSNKDDFKRLYEAVVKCDRIKKNNCIVAGTYLNRHNPDYFVGGNYNFENPKSTRDFRSMKKSSIVSVDFTGTGYIMFWKDLAPDLYEPYIDGIQAHDWAWCLKHIKNGGSILMMSDVNPRHYNTETDFIVPTDKHFIEVDNEVVIDHNNHNSIIVRKPKRNI